MVVCLHAVVPLRQLVNLHAVNEGTSKQGITRTWVPRHSRGPVGVCVKRTHHVKAVIDTVLRVSDVDPFASGETHALPVPFVCKVGEAILPNRNPSLSALGKQDSRLGLFMAIMKSAGRWSDHGAPVEA